MSTGKSKRKQTVAGEPSVPPVDLPEQLADDQENAEYVRTRCLYAAGVPADVYSSLSAIGRAYVELGVSMGLQVGELVAMIMKLGCDLDDTPLQVIKQVVSREMGRGAAIHKAADDFMLEAESVEGEAAGKMVLDEEPCTCCCCSGCGVNKEGN